LRLAGRKLGGGIREGAANAEEAAEAEEAEAEASRPTAGDEALDRLLGNPAGGGIAAASAHIAAAAATEDDDDDDEGAAGGTDDDEAAAGADDDESAEEEETEAAAEAAVETEEAVATVASSTVPSPLPASSAASGAAAASVGGRGSWSQIQMFLSGSAEHQIGIRVGVAVGPAPSSSAYWKSVASAWSHSKQQPVKLCQKKQLLSFSSTSQASLAFANPARHPWPRSSSDVM